MGMYTTLNLGVEFNPISVETLTILRYMVGEDVKPSVMDFPDPLPKLFEGERWHSMLMMNSASDVTQPPLLRRGFYSDRWELMVRASMKDYEGQCRLFIEWITPMVRSGFLGYTLYEDPGVEPTLFWKTHTGELVSFPVGEGLVGKELW